MQSAELVPHLAEYWCNHCLPDHCLACGAKKNRLLIKLHIGGQYRGTFFCTGTAVSVLLFLNFWEVFGAFAKSSIMKKGAVCSTTPSAAIV